ncbi:MAG: glycosyltransferase family 2 protein [Candidatus Brocadia sp.]|jgi:glycosyltransferase involved in cell wall biosynthesis
MPKVSVVIPTYNRPEFLSSAIASVLNQTFQDFEIIVVDDGSKDNTPEVVNRLNNKKIKYIRNEINKGEAGARNTGIMNSNSEYIAFLDDDDEWLPEKLALQVDLLKNSPTKVGVVYTGYIEVDKTSRKILQKIFPIKRGYIHRDLFIKNYVGVPSTVIVRRICFERIGLFDGNVVYPTDYDMWIRLSKEFHFEYIKKPLVKYYIHKNTISSNYEIRIQGIKVMLERYSNIYYSNCKAHSQYLIRLGILYCCNGSAGKGRESFLKAIRLYPFDVRNYIFLGLSLLGTNNFRRLQNFMKRF